MSPTIALASLSSFALGACAAILFFKTRRNTLTKGRHTETAIACADGGYYSLQLGSGDEYFSSELWRLFGFTEFEITFESFRPALDKTSFETLQALLSELKTGAQATPLQLISADGKKHYIARGLAEHDHRHQVTAVYVWFRDVTVGRSQSFKLAAENEKLKSEIKNFSATLNAMEYPVWRRNAELAITWCNRSYGEAAEEAPEKVLETTALELHRGARALAAQAVELKEGKSERRHIVVGGQRRLYQLFEVPTPDIGGTVGFAIDMTELETLQDELQRHVSAQTDLLESSTSAMVIYGADTRLKSYNNAFVRLWELDEPWLDTEPTYAEVLETLREKRRLPEQANFPAFKQQQMKLFTGLIEPTEEFFYLPDGKTLRVIAIPHALGGVLFAYEDVTDRLALERSYNTLIAVQRATLDNLHEGVVVYGEDGRVKLHNPIYRHLWKLSEADVSGEPHASDILDKAKEFYRYENWDSFKHEVIEMLHRRETIHQRLERADGSVLDRTLVPLPDGATLITYNDVTDSTLVERSLREKNEALTEADRLKSEFLANVSYELRSPLTSITGFSDMLAQNYFGDLSAKQREYVEGINRSSRHLMELINNILDLASIEAGYMKLEVHQFDVYKMLHSVFSLIRERTREKKISAKLDCPAKIGAMEGDETRLKQALFHLLSNALKFTEPGGEMLLGASKENGHIKIWVKDDGAGIDEEEHRAVFDKFYRGTRGTPKSGTGLGLSMVKSFIELHGGRVELLSKPGKGTTITCFLPESAKAKEKLAN